MKTLAAALITALLVFTLATGWSEFVQPRLELMALASAAKNSDVGAKSSRIRNVRRSAIDLDDEGEYDEEDEAPLRPGNKTARAAKRQRPESLAANPAQERLAAQLAEVKQQETKLVAREETLRMLYDDIRAELAAVEETRRRSAMQLATAERQVSASTLNRTSDGPANAAGETAVSAKPKITAESRIAGVIQDLASQGNVSAAGLLLSGMKDRDVAKVLTLLSTRDPRLALRLSDQVQASKQTAIRR